jgi:hypothetical protein
VFVWSRQTGRTIRKAFGEAWAVKDHFVVNETLVNFRWMHGLSIGGYENLDFDTMPFEFSRVVLVLMLAWSPDEDGADGGCINDPESRRVILKSSIDSDIGLAFEKNFLRDYLMASRQFAI